ncbi:hypothetical protein EOD39_11235 [Acipenser ruthenus]|uniref:CCHC-type domain-containing protein n=1 Tax=Acipenser ruthenus TaxID=7906 RepID=A0A662YS79_ACIRT|nr:hypothetical protein EOD39_11235 [Acipenser ruthenus]
MGLGELQKYLHLTKPRSLLAALQLIQEWEDMTQEESSACLHSTVRGSKHEESGTTGTCLCWECGQPGHIRFYCPRKELQPEAHRTLVGNEKGPM